MKFVILYTNDTECNSIYQTVKEIQKRYDGSILMQHDVYNKDTANKCFKTNISQLPALLVYPKYYHTKYNVFDNDEHYIYYFDNDNDDDLINFIKNKATLSNEYNNIMVQIKHTLLNNSNKYNKNDLIDDVKNILMMLSDQSENKI